VNCNVHKGRSPPGGGTPRVSFVLPQETEETRGNIIHTYLFKRMVHTHTVLGKVTALAMLPSLTLGIFAAPALAFESADGVTTAVTTTNINVGKVTNTIKVKADTGDNTSNGGNGGQGGTSGNSGSGAGQGGAGGAGGEGGDAEAEDGYAEGGRGGAGSTGGTGGSTGDTGVAGHGGNGGASGRIDTGNATAGATIYNAVNVNTTEIELPEDCGCEQYNEYYEAADSYYEQYRHEMHEATSEEEGRDNRDRHHGDRESSETEFSEADASEMGEAHWEVYSKEFVPVTTLITTTNMNVGEAETDGTVEAETGDNDSTGGTAGQGGNSGSTGSGAGQGGAGGEGGEGGSALVGDDNEMDLRVYGHDRRDHGDRDDEGTAVGGAGAEGSAGGNGGDTGTTGNAGNGGNGAESGVVWTGQANAKLELDNYVNVDNLKITRVVR
jgi:hypothetical protein